MKLSTLCYSLLLATSSSSVARVLADWELVGADGYCGDANSDLSPSWVMERITIDYITGVDFATCQETCLKTSLEGGCVGISYRQKQIPPECYIYAAKTKPAVPVTTIWGPISGADCYRYVSENTGKVLGVRYVTLLLY